MWQSVSVRRRMDQINPYDIDITEIEGFDNLHHAEGIIKIAQTEAAELYEADHSYFLINGSTCGILAAISAATDRGDKILVARNCHKAVYHGIYLRQLKPVYIYPDITRAGIQGQIRQQMVLLRVSSLLNILKTGKIIWELILILMRNSFPMLQLWIRQLCVVHTGETGCRGICWKKRRDCWIQTNIII